MNNPFLHSLHKVVIRFILFYFHQLLSPFSFFSSPCSLQDLSFPNRDWTCTLSSESRALTTGPPRESLQLSLKLTVLRLLQWSPPLYVTVPVEINNDLHIVTSYRQFSTPFYLFFWQNWVQSIAPPSKILPSLGAQDFTLSWLPPIFLISFPISFPGHSSFLQHLSLGSILGLFPSYM